MNCSDPKQYTASFGTPSNIFFITLVFFDLRWLAIKSHFLKSLHTKTFCLKYGVGVKIWSRFYMIAKF